MLCAVRFCPATVFPDDCVYVVAVRSVCHDPSQRQVRTDHLSFSESPNLIPGDVSCFEWPHYDRGRGSIMGEEDQINFLEDIAANDPAFAGATLESAGNQARIRSD
jgi:hypothetical protein